VLLQVRGDVEVLDSLAPPLPESGPGSSTSTSPRFHPLNRQRLPFLSNG
jgi:hypothetical protein